MTIVCDGNSLTAGYLLGAGEDYPAQLGLLRPADTVTNKGVNSQTTQDMINDATTDIDVLFTAGAWVCAWELTNDIYFGATASEAVTRIASYCGGRRAAGFKVAVLTCIPRGAGSDWTSSTLPADKYTNFTQRADEANTSIRAGFESYADVLVDVANDARFGVATNATYFNADQVHLTATGAALVAEMVNGGIAAFLRTLGRGLCVSRSVMRRR